MWGRNSDSPLHLAVKQSQPGAAFQFPLDVKAVNQSTGQSQQWTIEVASKVSEFDLECDFVPSTIILDPDMQLLFSGQVEKGNFR